jgi:hypothetical protein
MNVDLQPVQKTFIFHLMSRSKVGSKLNNFMSQFEKHKPENRFLAVFVNDEGAVASLSSCSTDLRQEDREPAWQDFRDAASCEARENMDNAF